MTSFAFDPEPQKILPIRGIGLMFPLNQIYCVGRNYADHAIEMGFDPSRDAPFFFMKPNYSIFTHQTDLAYPDQTNDLHHEVELVVALGSGGANLTAAQAEEAIYGYAVGLDLTRRDLQAIAKEQSRPWDAGKSFLHSAPCSIIVPKSEVQDVENLKVSLHVNNELRQNGNTNQMIWKIKELIIRLSELFPLYAGDLIYTGTPAGVGPLSIGDKVTADIEGLGELTFSVFRKN
ncbi:MAG: fumarylpyruvate hydrolase [Candidatus Azotimanducaceae bacterium]|jgi:fumarylpyruvate hydrolase